MLLRACASNAKRVAHLSRGVSFCGSGVAIAAPPCKFRCKTKLEFPGFAVFYMWHAICIILEQHGGYENTRPEGGGQPRRSDYREVGLP